MSGYHDNYRPLLDGGIGCIDVACNRFGGNALGEREGFRVTVYIGPATPADAGRAVFVLPFRYTVKNCDPRGHPRSTGYGLTNGVHSLSPAFRAKFARSKRSDGDIDGYI